MGPRERQEVGWGCVVYYPVRYSDSLAGSQRGMRNKCVGSQSWRENEHPSAHGQVIQESATAQFITLSYIKLKCPPLPLPTFPRQNISCNPFSIPMNLFLSFSFFHLPRALRRPGTKSTFYRKTVPFLVFTSCSTFMTLELVSFLSFLCSYIFIIDSIFCFIK